MKRQIRRSVFETNSSSMHSFVILKDDRPKRIHDPETEFPYINEDGVWEIWGYHLEFGRTPFRCLCTIESKIRYAIASMVSHGKCKFEEVEEIAIKYIPGCTKIEIDNQSCYGYGYTDEDLLTPFLTRKKITLEDFITNDKYVIICDGDEYCIYDNLKVSGLINTDLIAEEWGG